MFKSAGLAKMFAGRRKFFRGPHAARMFVTYGLVGTKWSIFNLAQAKFSLTSKGGNLATWR